MSTLRLLLGFDYGTKQIGVAVGQAVTGQARELCVLKAQNGLPDWSQIEALLREWQPDALVVGLPLNMDGSSSITHRLAFGLVKMTKSLFVSSPALVMS